MVSPTNDGESLLIDIEDVEREMPGMIQHTVNWFRIYKMPTGKPPNQFAFDAKPKNKAFAEDVIRQTHVQWLSLIEGKVDKGAIGV